MHIEDCLSLLALAKDFKVTYELGYPKIMPECSFACIGVLDGGDKTNE